MAPSPQYNDSQILENTDNGCPPTPPGTCAPESLLELNLIRPQEERCLTSLQMEEHREIEEIITTFGDDIYSEAVRVMFKLLFPPKSTSCDRTSNPRNFFFLSYVVVFGLSICLVVAIQITSLFIIFFCMQADGSQNEPRISVSPQLEAKSDDVLQMLICLRVLALMVLYFVIFCSDLSNALAVRRVGTKLWKFERKENEINDEGDVRATRAKWMKWICLLLADIQYATALGVFFLSFLIIEESEDTLFIIGNALATTFVLDVDDNMGRLFTRRSLFMLVYARPDDFGKFGTFAVAFLGVLLFPYFVLAAVLIAWCIGIYLIFDFIGDKLRVDKWLIPFGRIIVASSVLPATVFGYCIFCLPGASAYPFTIVFCYFSIALVYVISVCLPLLGKVCEKTREKQPNNHQHDPHNWGLCSSSSSSSSSSSRNMHDHGATRGL